MIIISDTLDFKLNSKTAVAIGKFDGLHLGHRRLLEILLEKRQQGLKACVFTFAPSPSVLFGLSDGKELTVQEEKRRMLEELGVDILVEFPLNPETAAIPAELFVKDILADRLQAKWVVAGEDLSFGAKGAGDAALLCRMAEQLHFHVTTIPKISIGGREISSTYIRQLVEEGALEQAAAFLGRSYSVLGTVSHGKKLGRTIGMPTVNVLPREEKLLPPAGVYYSAVKYGEQIYKAITNIGCKPTVSEERVMAAEAHLFDFEGNLYGVEAEIFLHAFKRPEMKFESIEALMAQMHRDKEDARLLFTKYQ